MSERPKLIPADTPDHMVAAWVAALHWAIKQPEMLERFSKEMNITWRPGTTPLDRMVADPTGAHCKFIESFIAWFNMNVWGMMDETEKKP